ncbi:MAG: SAP domain-containing protein [Synechococcus sp. SB0678_bin_12]|nr:SAP domain-containing protein [Synechococcus sp. SB0678_bin_12]MYI87700.1 SAP domain-containing protein [Synechococcus sp. SB0672_bin_10]
MKLLGHEGLIQDLAEHPGRPYWSSWDSLKALGKSYKVSITKKHTDCLDNYFRFDPQPLPSLSINVAPAEDLSRHLYILPLGTGSADQLSHQLSGSPSRLYWRDCKDMTRALRAEAQFTIPKATQTILVQKLDFTPEPPPVPNTIPFLLQQMTVKELRREADERGMDHKGKKKADLVRLLSSG